MIGEWARHPCYGTICRGQKACACTFNGRDDKQLCQCRTEKWVPTYRRFGVWARHPCCGSICRGWNDTNLPQNCGCDCQRGHLYQK